MEMTQRIRRSLNLQDILQTTVDEVRQFLGCDRAFPIKNEAGEIVRIAGIAEDITEQQKIEQMKSEFIGIVSHELRTPLTAIRAAMGLLNTGIYIYPSRRNDIASGLCP
ncbi:hypothetical protein CEN44_23865 [Fischerella muscicola CCMEE 5323]|uniref:histidine kinase n=2 Tax=Hapalosiphonaceae TaxID=1892263 RepID=A0A2N6JX09_FISMU|nr:GAF domain-containing protein [Fischerella sp. FACHB-380]PLZ84786.1 hypothetical protein CEN44_23865 [Fischerella muscicola CCMEE 5323]